MYYSKPLTSYESICQVLDNAAEASVRPLDWRKPLYAAIDQLHATGAPEEQIRIAERISIVLLKLDWAILRRDSDKAAATRRELTELGESWRGLVEAGPLDLQQFVCPEQSGGVACHAEAESESATIEFDTAPAAHLQVPASIDFGAFRSAPMQSERIDFAAARRDTASFFNDDTPDETGPTFAAPINDGTDFGRTAQASHNLVVENAVAGSMSTHLEDVSIDDDDDDLPGIDFLAVAGAQAPAREPSNFMDDMDVDSMTERLDRITFKARFCEE